MDEPLSNLDAKLRVQMRSEISRIQHELGVTTIYVTHDQTEAMTMGDRVAVIRKGLLQQVDTPQYLYDHPLNLFVAGFIGSPAMNLVEANVSLANGAGAVEFAGFRLGVPREVLGARPDLRSYDGRRVIVGIRPEDMEDASLVADAPQDHRIRSVVMLREALGADVLAHFKVQAPEVVTEDVKELAHDVGVEALEAREHGAQAGESTFLARLNPRTGAHQDEPIELVVDVHRLHFFDPDTGLGIYGGDQA
jgi:multiple sugar transport system ATP-binding protein